MSKTKIFVVYHKPYHVFRSKIFEPIQTGADFSGIDLGFLKDNTGDNIAYKNPNYGELTAWYWVWKNWLPVHPETEYIGFCHYRRFLDANEPLQFFEDSYRACTATEFIKRFNSSTFSKEAIETAIGDFDILLPPLLNVMSFEQNFRGGNLYDQYSRTHPQSEFVKAAEVFAKEYGVQLLKDYWRGSSFHSCLNFTMRRALYENLCQWMFAFLTTLEKQSEWGKYTLYNEIRTPAFLAERYFDLWLTNVNSMKTLKIKTCPRWVLDSSPVPNDCLWYLSGIKQWLLWKLGIQKHLPLPDCLQ